tara:strand:+ start:16783 stop:18018 length:1236 start_codon:yes stop_codon:yes gene_type:complete
MKKILSSILLMAGTLTAGSANAVVTYANCPTLAPLPVTSFMPAAMLPIQTAENAFDIGMNQVVKTAVSMATEMQAQAISSSFSSILQSMIETSQAYDNNKFEIERQYAELMMAYEMDLAAKKEELDNMLFPGDPSMMQPKPGEVRQINSESPSYKFVKEMCSAGKMQQAMTSQKVVRKAKEKTNRRSQKITTNIQAVSSISSKAKQNIDRHYDIFCSETDLNNGLCDQVAMTPNADLDAGVFMYPSGYVGEGNSNGVYQTLYTYSPVESLAAYQYVKNLTGTLYLAPPTANEINSPRKVRFVSAYKQMIAALSVSTDAMLFLAEQREPINKEGLVMGPLDAMNYMIEKSKAPEHLRVIRSASDNGKMLEMQRQLSLQQNLRMTILKQKDRLRQLKAVKTSLDATKSALQDD